MGWDLILIGLVGVVLFRTEWRGIANRLIGPTCPECRQARVRQVRELGELWGTSTHFSTCPACGRHFRHDEQLVAVGRGSLVESSDTNSATPRSSDE